MDAISSKDLQEEAPTRCKCRDVVLDMEELTYISSSGLRAILVMNRAVGRDNKLSVVNAKGSVKEVLDMSGFSDIL